MTYRFFLNPDSDNLEIEEPKGFSGIELRILRDETYHGISYEASTNSLDFYGVAYTFLKEQKELNGLKANAIFKAEINCDGSEEYETILQGRLNFGKYKETCGAECLISLPVEQDGCVVTLKNRWDQKTDINNAKGFDGLTVLPAYDGLGIEIELSTRNLNAAVEGAVDILGDTVEFETELSAGDYTFEARPTYTELNNSIPTGQLIPTVPFSIDPDVGIETVVSPLLLFDDEEGCFSGDFDYEFRLKGSALLEGGEHFHTITSAKIFILKATGDYHDSPTVLHEVDLSAALLGGVDDGSPRSATFDESFSGTTTLAQGESIFAFVSIGFNVGFFFSSDPKFTIEFDTETTVNITAPKECPATDAEVNLIHETLSRAAEAVTNYCTRVKSEYYGRTDSEPFAFEGDGCGALRVVTSGLKIRRAVDGKFFTSLKDLIEGLNPVDNIGFDVVDDPDRPGQSIMRIEDVNFFYQDEEILECDLIPEASRETEEGKHYSKILVGYKKWEVEKINGLDEFNSNREYRTSLSTVSNLLDITSSLVAGSYPIEVTRQQSFAETGAADTKYDNETFIICVRRNAYGLEVEQGNINEAENIFSPETAYNFRLSPLRNLMRWYKSIAPSYPNLSDSDNKLFFSAGTGNIEAKGILSDTPGYSDDLCRLESIAIRENQNIFTTHFEDVPTPLWKNELIPFEYPLSVKEYNEIKSNPYGYVNFQCGTGEFEKGWIKEIKFRLNEGKATITLKKKWE